MFNAVAAFRLRPLPAALIIALLPAAAFAEPMSFKIGAQPLASALDHLAEQSGLQVIYNGELVQGLQSPGVNGLQEPQAALEHLLSGSGLAWRSVGAASVTLYKRPADSSALELSATSVIAQTLDDSTENTGSYTTGSVAVGSKVAKSLREVPHSVSVITRQQIEDQNLHNLTDVMDKTPGVTSRKATQRAGSSFGNDSNFYSRGFEVSNVQLDGGAPMDPSMSGFGSVSQLDMAQFDHVEFLRGVDGLYSGAGDPGGTINMVRKRALAHNQLAFSTSAGSWDNYRSEADITGPLTEQGNVRGRLGIAYQDRKYFYDPGNMTTKVAYGSLEFDLSPDTLLTVGGSYQEAQGVINFAGLPRAINGDDLKLSRKHALTTDWNTSHEKTAQGYIRLQHSFSEDWAMTLDAMRMEMDRDAKGIFGYGAVNPITGNGHFITGYPAKTGMDRDAYSATLKGGFDLFARHHELVIVGDYQKGKAYSRQRMSNFMEAPINIFNPVMPADNGDFPVKDDYYTSTKTGLSGMLRMSITDPMNVILGARVANYKHADDSFYKNADGTSAGSQGKRALEDNGVVTPYVGVTYDLTDQWTAYTSYAETYRPQYMQLKGPYPGSPLDPSEAKSYEVGLKGELFSGRLNTSFALYRVEQTGDAAADGPSQGWNQGKQCCFINQGETISQGLDAEISGELQPGWQMSAGYTYNHSRDADTQNAEYRAITPKHMVKLWTTYQLPGMLHNWKVGGGVVAQSATYVSGTVREYNPVSGEFDGAEQDFKFIEPGRAIWSTSVDYKIDENWSATIIANNLFDKRYYETFGSSASGNFYGEPRSLALTVRSKF